MIVAHTQEDDAGGTDGQAGEHGGGPDIHARPQISPDLVHGFLAADGDENGGENATDQVNAPIGKTGGCQGIASRREPDPPAALPRIFFPGSHQLRAACLVDDQKRGLLVQFVLVDGDPATFHLHRPLMPLRDILRECAGGNQGQDAQEEESECFHNQDCCGYPKQI